MAEAGTNISNPSIPLFKGENYELWSIKMVTLFKSQGLWDLVNNGVPDSDPNRQENEWEDARALFYIQLAVHDTIFSRICNSHQCKGGMNNPKNNISREY
jgi:hypothetical protein